MLLVVAATEVELRGAGDAATLACGIGPVEAALATARALAERRPTPCSTSASPVRAIEPPALVLGSESVYCDVLDPAFTMPRVERVGPDPELLAAARAGLPDALVLPIATCGKVGGGVGYDVEAMEGFGVLRAAALAGVPAVELRAISNAVGEPDRSPVALRRRTRGSGRRRRAPRGGLVAVASSPSWDDRRRLSLAGGSLPSRRGETLVPGARRAAARRAAARAAHGGTARRGVDPRVRRPVLPSLALGIGPALIALGTVDVSRTLWLVLAPTVVAAVLSVSLTAASVLALKRRPPLRRLAVAWGCGWLVFAPLPFLVLAFVLPGLAWLAAVGLVVPVLVVEDLAPRAAFARAWSLARADYVHALGSLATLAIVVFLTQAVLAFLLRGVGGAAISVAYVLANMVVSPLLFLGAALLYVDQSARVK